MMCLRCRAKDPRAQVMNVFPEIWVYAKIALPSVVEEIWLHQYLVLTINLDTEMRQSIVKNAKSSL
jgi:hypothetical protein